MKIVQINVTCGHGSTGVIAVEIAELLESKGHDAYIAFGQGDTTFNKSYRIGSKFENKLHGLINTRIYGEEGTGSYFGTRKFIKWLDSIQPDIIHIHNLHSNYLNYELFFQYILNKNIPVVWSFFDCWPFTGKCTHFTEHGCRKWEKVCCHCPQLKTSGPKTWFFDKTRKMFLKKKHWFDKVNNLHIIVCSDWLKREVGKSICNNHPVHMIYNWIDQEKFRPIVDESIYSKYGVDNTKKVLVSVSASWGDDNTRLSDAIRLASILPDDYELVLIGKLVSKRELPNNIVHIDFVKGTDELSKLYTCALAYVNFSVEDTFGKVMAEAQLCGTPAIVFDATACPEVVGDAGFVVPPHDVKAMFSCVEEISKLGRDYYSEKCINYVKTNFNYHNNVGEYLKIYEQILSEREVIIKK